ncbi:DUF4810 domain-containing protein [Candidimonas sp. SYP-B2681]|nr:DUF4810 domain-containing protein [Candidimonas sp. SYP-B2681]
MLSRPKQTVFRLSVAVILTGGLAACVQPQKLMYNWQSYQAGVYDYLKDADSDYAAQAALLEQNVEIARSADQALPPGFRAHLGMLYLKQGKADKAVEQLHSEKLAFPEATPFMDFLLRNAESSASKGQKSLSVPDAATAGPSSSTAIKSRAIEEAKKGT